MAIECFFFLWIVGMMKFIGFLQWVFVVHLDEQLIWQWKERIHGEKDETSYFSHERLAEIVIELGRRICTIGKTYNVNLYSNYRWILTTIEMISILK